MTTVACVPVTAEQAVAAGWAWGRGPPRAPAGGRALPELRWIGHQRGLALLRRESPTPPLRASSPSTAAAPPPLSLRVVRKKAPPPPAQAAVP